MKNYIQFLIKQNGKTVDALGSEGVFILDGRNSLSTMVNDGKNRMAKLEKVQPHYIGFNIMAGSSFSNSRVLKTILK